jgi:hypothetical protein
LQTNVPAVCDTDAGMPCSRSARRSLSPAAAEPGRRTVGHDRHVNRLLAFIIGNTRIIDVYRDTFDGNIDTTTRLPDRYR